ncbi:MAG: fibronectin type III domain-containing protein, partial [bacterium]|nr:fibronectin type III domain-containing protein [bacterium]
MILNTHLMKMSGVIPTLILLFIVTLSFATPLDSLECTLGVVRCEQTSDGRTMLWKNRDIPNRNQAVHFGGGSNGEYRYVGIGTVGEGSIVHGGANEVGFGVVGSDSYNIGEGNVGPDDDGTIMTLALKTCHTIAQFRHILDSTNTAGGGRTLPTNYVAFDSANTVSIFEAGRNSYFEYSINSSYSFQVRANYSFSGPPPSNDWEWGFYRKKRAFQLFEKMLVSDNFHVDSLPSIARDIAPPGWTSVAFPIPTGYSDTLWTEGGICRYSSVSTFFIQGGKHTETGWLPPVCWFMLGKPYAAMAVPVWPHQTDISQLLTDQVTSRSALCDRSLLLQDSATNNNPTRIHDQQYLRLRNTIETAELQTFDYVLPQITTPISAATAQAISDSMANYAYSTLLGIPLVPLANAPTAAQVTAATTTSLSLSWTDQSNNESRFVLFRSTNGVAFDSVGATANNVTSYLDAGLTPYTKYWYRVYAFNGGGYSSAFASTTDTTVVDYVNAPVVHANPNPLTEPFITNAPGDPNTADHPPVAIAFPANLLGNPTSLSLSYRTSAPPIVPAEFIPPSTTIAKFWNIETTGGDGFDATLDLY